MLDGSELYKKYQETIDPRSAFEILNERVQAVKQEQGEAVAQTQAAKTSSRSTKVEKSTFQKKCFHLQITKQVGKELVRGVFGMCCLVLRQEELIREGGGNGFHPIQLI